VSLHMIDSKITYLYTVHTSHTVYRTSHDIHHMPALVSHFHALHTSLALSLQALRTSPSPQLCELVAETLLTYHVAKILFKFI